MSFIHINKKWCKRCGICIDLCPKDVLGKDDDGYPVVINEDACIRCRLCELRCPDLAIELEDQNG
jgi:2-oxoglutarate ferredoxin oxidoreductase subunit delta